MKDDIDNHTGKWVTSCQNDMNFGSLTVKNWTGVFTHLLKIMSFLQLRPNGKYLTAYIFVMKHDIDNLSSALETTTTNYIVSKPHQLWFTNGLK